MTVGFNTIIYADNFSYNVDTNGNSIEQIEYQNSDDEDFMPETNVFAQVGSLYKVTIPKVIVLSGVQKQSSYYVKVEGDIAGCETIYVEPEDTVDLYSTNKFMQTGIITQDKIAWTNSTLGTNANGQVIANGLTAGKWSGIFYFNIDMNKVLGDVINPEESNIIKFVVNDELIDVIPIEDGKKVNFKRQIPKKANYHFVGWAESENGQAIYGTGNVNNIYCDAVDEDGNLIYDDAMANKDANPSFIENDIDVDTLYAVYEKDAYTININNNGVGEYNYEQIDIIKQININDGSNNRINVGDKVTITPTLFGTLSDNKYYETDTIWQYCGEDDAFNTDDDIFDSEDRTNAGLKRQRIIRQYKIDNWKLDSEENDANDITFYMPNHSVDLTINSSCEIEKIQSQSYMPETCIFDTNDSSKWPKTGNYRTPRAATPSNSSTGMWTSYWDVSSLNLGQYENIKFDTSGTLYTSDYASRMGFSRSRSDRHWYIGSYSVKEGEKHYTDGYITNRTGQQWIEAITDGGETSGEYVACYDGYCPNGAYREIFVSPIHMQIFVSGWSDI